MSANGHKGVSPNYPFTPGIDVAGEVAWSRSEKYREGDKVLVTGYKLGMTVSGGFQQYVRVPESWIVPLPEDVSPREAMIYGTAGFTAGICVDQLQKHQVLPGSGPILVDGATGGVGSLAIAFLSKAGYKTVASTGKLDKVDMLAELGADEVLSREDIIDRSGRPLLKGRWAGAVDNVGGETLSSIIRSVKPRGAVCSVGLVASDKFETTVYPFILRGVSLIGIDSAERPMNYRLEIWRRIFEEWRLASPDRIVKETTLDKLSEEIDLTLAGKQTGRVIVNLEND